VLPRAQPLAAIARRSSFRIGCPASLSRDSRTVRQSGDKGRGSLGIAGRTIELVNHSAVIAREGGRSCIPEKPVRKPKSREKPVRKPKSRGVLDAPPEPVIGRRFASTRWRGMTMEGTAPVIPSASEAIQSHACGSGLLRRFAPRNDGDIRSHPRRAIRARVMVKNLVPRKSEGAGKTGCPHAPVGPRAKKYAQRREDHR